MEWKRATVCSANRRDAHVVQRPMEFCRVTDPDRVTRQSDIFCHWSVTTWPNIPAADGSGTKYMQKNLLLLPYVFIIGYRVLFCFN